MWEVFKTILVPILSVAVSAYVALLAIRSADKRERDRQRRDDLCKFLDEFFTAGALAEDCLNNEQTTSWTGTDSEFEAQRTTVNRKYFRLRNQFEALNMRLVSAGEWELATAITDYFAKAAETQKFVRGLLCRGSHYDATNQIENLHRERSAVANKFVAELEILRQPRRKPIRERWREWWKRLEERWRL